MAKETLGAWGEFVGGIAVVLTLIYLAFQTRQNSKQIEQSLKLHALAMATSHAGNFQKLWSTIAQDEELGSLWKRSQQGGELTEAETARIDALYMIWALALENLIVQMGNPQLGSMLGVEESDVENALDDIVVGYIGTESGRRWWSNEKTFGPLISGVIDGALRRRGYTE